MIVRFAVVAGAWMCLALSLPGCSPTSQSSEDARAANSPTGTAEDLDGRSLDPLAASQGEVAVLVFVRRDCPISNRYAPTLHELHDQFAPRGVSFYLVYPNPSTTADEIRKHLRDYEYMIPAVRDPRHTLVTLTGARVTPEAAVFNRKGELVYRGRIDDRYVDFGKARAQPTSHDLQAAVEATLAGAGIRRPVTEAVGCFISDLQ
jgi:hypothetical protein